MKWLNGDAWICDENEIYDEIYDEIWNVLGFFACVGGRLSRTMSLKL
jgi:hypothetical protein